MNIRRFSGDGREGTPDKAAVDNVDVVWRKKAIGPEDRYNDDFSYGQATFFHEDPLLNEEYGRLLDIRYRVQKEQQQHQEGATSAATTTTATTTTAETGGRSQSRRPMMRREKTWHGDKFQDFQMLDKANNEKVLLTIQRSIAQNVVIPQTLSNDKIPWSPVKAFEEIRKVKEAPPKNVVQNRLRQFEKHDDAKHDESPTFSLTSLETNAERRERFFRGDDEFRSFDSHLQRKLTEKVRDFALRSEEPPVKERVEELAERETEDVLDRALLKAEHAKINGGITAVEYHQIADKVASLKKLRFVEEYERL